MIAGPDQQADWHQFVLQDEKVFCALDPRWTYTEVALDHGAVGRLALVTIESAESLSPGYREQLGLPGATGPVMFVGGGVAQFRAGVWTSSPQASQRLPIVTELVGLALARAREGGYHPVAPFVPETDASAFLAASEGAVAKPRESWCSLDFAGAATVDELISHQERKHRQTWRRDQRDAASFDLTHDVVEFDDDTAREAAPLIASVSARNGVDEHPQVVRWRLTGYLQRPGRHWYVRSRVGSEVVAYTACRAWGSTLDAHTVGIAEPCDERRSVYHYAAYLAPLTVALEAGLSRLDLGYAHETPKLGRGCRATPITFVHFANAEPGLEAGTS